MTLGSVRHEARIHHSAADVWALVGDPARLHEWFPGIVACTVDGCWPVSMVARDGMQTTDWGTARS